MSAKNGELPSEKRHLPPSWKTTETSCKVSTDIIGAPSTSMSVA